MIDSIYLKNNLMFIVSLLSRERLSQLQHVQFGQIRASQWFIRTHSCEEQERSVQYQSLERQ